MAARPKKTAAPKPAPEVEALAPEVEATGEHAADEAEKLAPAGIEPDAGRDPWHVRLAAMDVAEIEAALGSGLLGERKTTQARARLTELRRA